MREARCRPREGAGGGRGVGAAGRAQPQSHALGSRTPKQHTDCFGSHSRLRRSGALRGLPAPLSPVQFPCLGLAPRTSDPGREAWGSPRCRSRGLPKRAAWLPRYWAAPGLCARLHALPAAAARLLSNPRLLLSCSLLLPHTPARGLEVDGRLGDSLTQGSPGILWPCLGALIPSRFLPP